MRANEFHISDPVEELAKKLPNLKRYDYDAIDELMQRICKKHKLSGQKLHDLFVKKYGHTPDTWIKKIKQRNENVSEQIGQRDEYILFIDGKPAAKYQDLSKAEMDMKHLQQKFPNKRVTIDHQVCKLEPVTTKNLFKENDFDDDDDNYSHSQGYSEKERAFFKKAKEHPKVGLAIDRSTPGKIIARTSNKAPAPKPVGKYRKPTKDTGRDYAVRSGATPAHLGYDSDNPVYSRSKYNESEIDPKKKDDSPEKIAQIKKFIDWSVKTLHVKDPLPQFEFSTDTEAAQKGHHTGVHTPEDNKIWVYIGNRNLVDILRTVFHELVHERQTQLGMIKPGDSYPGSPIEAMADMLSGKYIKIYGKQHPEIFQ